ncbi:MAG: aminotransferase class I/II-fold pyridoxal phosphate-dependent enzyme, partial [Pseudomonadota bacterium]
MLGQRMRVSSQFPARLIGPRLTAIASGLAADIPFVGPEAIERDRSRVFRARIGANENPFGPSPLALEALHATLCESWMYGDPENSDLRHALAAHHDLDPACIVVGEGIDALLGYAVRLFVEPADAVVTSSGAYPTFSYHVNGYGGRLVKVPYFNDAADTDALIRAARDNNAAMIYLANPDNPMGSWTERPYLEAMINQLPDQCLLLLDEAYSDFAPEDALPD